MTPDTCFLSRDELHLLASIAEDCTRSADEREEAHRRLWSDLNLRLAMGVAGVNGALDRLTRTMEESTEAFRVLGLAMDTMADQVEDRA